MVTAMLFAGGIGARMKYSDMPKQFLEVGGKPIIIHTMELLPVILRLMRLLLPVRLTGSATLMSLLRHSMFQR